MLLHYSVYMREGERLQSAEVRAPELCESRGGRPGLVQSLIVCTVSVDVKQHLKRVRNFRVLHGTTDRERERFFTCTVISTEYISAMQCNGWRYIYIYTYVQPRQLFR